MRVRKFRPFTNPAGTMAGFLSVELPSGLILNDCKLMIGAAGKRWIGLPAVKRPDAEDQPQLDVDGKAQ